MRPFTELAQANENFTKLQNMIVNKQRKITVPEFRFVALEEEFCKFLTGLCEVFKTYGTLNQVFDIKQMIHTLKIPDWKEIIPFAYYLNPLEKSIKDCRDLIQKMKDQGPLHISYVLEDNEDLQ